MRLPIPLLILVVLAYNAVALTGAADLAQPMLSAGLVSGVRWSLTIGDLLVALGVLLLYLEIFKATRSSNTSIIDHLLSMVLFVVVLVQFLLLPAFGTSTFFLLLLLCFVDVIAGFTVTISSARRDIERV